VQAALEERRSTGRGVPRSRLTIADRCRDAAERRLRVRAFLIGNTSAGIAQPRRRPIDDREHQRRRPTCLAYVAVDALVRLTVAEVRTDPERHH
jgi:hypothetical protein